MLMAILDSFGLHLKKKKEPGIEIVIHGFSNFEAIIYGTFLYQIIVHGFNHI